MSYHLSIMNLCSHRSGGHFGIILGSFRRHSGVIPGSFRSHSGVILASFWGHSRVISGSFQGLLCGICADSAPVRRRVGAGSNPAHRAGRPSGGSRPLLPLEEPSTETLLGNKKMLAILKPSTSPGSATVSHGRLGHGHGHGRPSGVCILSDFA